MNREGEQQAWSLWKAQQRARKKKELAQLKKQFGNPQGLRAPKYVVKSGDRYGKLSEG